LEAIASENPHITRPQLIRRILYFGTFVMASTSTVQLLNPDAPMAWLRPSLAKKMTIQIDIATGSLAVSFMVSHTELGHNGDVQILLWDIIVHIPADYKLLTQFRLNASMLIYCISR